MKTTKPLVSIVTPVYNGGKYIEELIKSVLEQDYENIEHVVIDDGSNDNGQTVRILQRYPHLRWWSRENKGQYSTLNEGIMASRGELLTLICADDLYASKKAISNAVELWTRTSNCEAVYGDTLSIDENGRIADDAPPNSGPVWTFRYYHNAICHCSLLVDRNWLLSKKLFFDESFVYAGDHDWILKLLRNGCRLKRLREPIAKYRRHPAQLTQDGNPVRLQEQKRITMTYGDINPILNWIIGKWWRSAKLKNLMVNRGMRAGTLEVAKYIRKRLKN